MGKQIGKFRPFTCLLRLARKLFRRTLGYVVRNLGIFCLVKVKRVLLLMDLLGREIPMRRIGVLGKRRSKVLVVLNLKQVLLIPKRNRSRRCILVGTLF